MSEYYPVKFLKKSRGMYMQKIVKREFVAYFHFVGWDCLSLGLHLCWRCPNIEIHLPFGFIKIGWSCTYGGLTAEELISKCNKDLGIKPDNRKDMEAIRQAFAEIEED